MVKESKLYSLLGVTPSANDNEIKKAYRKMALKYHPDKPTGNEDKFKEISEAFDILSNSEKRALYDQYGLEAARHGQAPMPDFGAGAGGPRGAGAGPGAGGMPFEFNFGNGGGMPGGVPGGGMPGASSFFGGGGGGRGSGGFSTADAFNIFNAFTGGMGGPGGGSRFANFDDDSDDGIPGFGGAKRSRQVTKPDPLVVKLPVSIGELFTGTTKKLKIGRRGASGVKEFNILEVVIRPGWKAGTKVTFTGKGDVQPNGTVQDVIFEIEEKPSDKFRRAGNDLFQTVDLTLREALTGYSKVIETIDGKKLKISQISPTRPGSTNRYPGRGMPLSKSPSQHGDLVLEFKVDWPVTLTSSQKDAINANFSL